MKYFKILWIMSNEYPYIVNCNNIMYIVLLSGIYFPLYVCEYAYYSLIFECL